MTPSHWPPTRAAALARLDAFLPNSGSRYARDRNADPAPSERFNVSGLSPYLRHRAIAEQEVLQAVLGRYARSTAEKFTQEVMWRAYFKGWLEHRPNVWWQYIADVSRLFNEIGENRRLAKTYERAVAGDSGIEPFDIWIRELKRDGYLHNHARMWFASIWIFTLKLPWQLGADLFLRHLLDGDPASNTCSWRWVGGLHTRGKTYLARASNIERYAARFDTAKGLNRLATSAPALSEAPDLLALERIKPSWPEAEIEFDPATSGLLLHDDDLTAHSHLSFKARAGLTASPLSPAGGSDLVQSFRTGLISDALNSIDGGRLLFDDDIRDWASDQKLKTIVLPYAPVGQTQDRLALIRSALRDTGINVVTTLRPYDRAIWPHANAGFFKVGKRIPTLLDELGL